MVTQSSKPELSSHRVQGATTRAGEVVGIDCATTIVYDIREATGSAVLAQRYLVHLRTRPLRRGTRYTLDCAGPLIVEIPAAAYAVRATTTSAAGRRHPLPVTARAQSLPLAFGRRLRAEAQTQLALVGWPRRLPIGDYRVVLSFNLPQPRAFREKALYAASISSGGSRYLQPILPLTTMTQAPAFTIRPSTSTIMMSVPRIAGAIGTETQV